MQPLNSTPPPTPTFKKTQTQKYKTKYEEREEERHDQEKTVVITYLQKSKGMLELTILTTNIHSFIHLAYSGKISSAARFVVDIPNHKN